MRGIAAKAREDRVVWGILLTLFAYLMFSFIDTSAKWLGIIGIPAIQLVFMRYVGAFVISTAMIARGGISLKRFESEQFGLVFLRSVMIMVSTGMNFVAVQFIPLTLTSTILFSAPIIICALSWPLLGERVGLWRWAAIMLGFCGIMVAIRPFDENFHWAVFLSLGAATGFAMYSILTRKLSGVVATDTLQFYVGFIGTICTLPFAIWFWQHPETGFQWLVMLMLGVFAWIGHELFSRALGYAPASALSPFSYAFILYLTVWSFFVFDHVPDVWTMSGAAIIVMAGLVIWFRERRNADLKTSSNTTVNE